MYGVLRRMSISPMSIPTEKPSRRFLGSGPPLTMNQRDKTHKPFRTLPNLNSSLTPLSQFSHLPQTPIKPLLPGPGPSIAISASSPPPTGTPSPEPAASSADRLNFNPFLLECGLVDVSQLESELGILAKQVLQLRRCSQCF